MEVNTKTYTILKASDGYVLTNGTSYGKSVVLGVGDSADNWHEITETEYEKILQEQEQQIEE